MSLLSFTRSITSIFFPSLILETRHDKKRIIMLLLTVVSLWSWQYGTVFLLHLVHIRCYLVNHLPNLVHLWRASQDVQYASYNMHLITTAVIDSCYWQKFLMDYMSLLINYVSSIINWLTDSDEHDRNVYMCWHRNFKSLMQ